MTKAEGQCRINGVTIGELSADLLSASERVTAQYAYVNTDTGERFGRGHRNVWSQETMDKFHELVAHMEKDICLDLFGQGTTITGVNPPQASTSDGVPEL